MNLGDAYTAALATGPTYGYLWILSRTPTLPREDLDRIVDQAARLGFDTQKLIVVDQSKNTQP